MNNLKPTSEFYGLFQRAFDTFNTELFENKLQQCLITVHREKRTMGYFSPNRWAKKNGDMSHEISLNPLYFATHSFIEIFQTLGHEMCHLWQYDFGTPSRKSYHNKEWADKMEEIGLMPSDNGKPNGKKTGQKMADYPIHNGRFYKVCNDFLNKNINYIWVDRFPLSSEPAQQRSGRYINKNMSMSVKQQLLNVPILELMPKEIIQSEQTTSAGENQIRNKSKFKYFCNGCNVSVWGKSGLKIHCLNCDSIFLEKN